MTRTSLVTRLRSLKRPKRSAGFHCSHSMRVQHAVMTAMGYAVRDLGVDSDHLVFGKSNHHGVKEVWSNEYAKWVLLDAKYDIHFERAGNLFRPWNSMKQRRLTSG